MSSTVCILANYFYSLQTVISQNVYALLKTHKFCFAKMSISLLAEASFSVCLVWNQLCYVMMNDPRKHDGIIEIIQATQS